MACTRWFLTPSFSSQPLGPQGNPAGGAMCPGLAMEAGLTLPQDPVIGSTSSKWTETCWPCAGDMCPAVHHGAMEIHNGNPQPPATWSSVPRT